MTDHGESPTRPETTPGEYLARVVAILTDLLGPGPAADAWLDSRETGYPTTARDAITEGHGAMVVADLEDRSGPGPSYS